MKTIAYPQTASFFTLIIFFCENKLFQRDGGGGVFVLYCGNSGGVEEGGGGSSVPHKYGKSREVGES